MAPSLHPAGPKRSFEPAHKRKGPDRLSFALIGASGVGKESLIEQFRNPSNGVPVFEYDPVREPVISTFPTVDGHPVLVDLESVPSRRGDYVQLAGADQAVRDGKGLVLVYDTTSEASFLDIKQWLVEYRDHHAKQYYKRDVAFLMLIGNKNDRDAERQVTWEQGRQLARKLRAEFVETSAGDSEAVKQLFHDLVRITRNRPWPTRVADSRPPRVADTRPPRFAESKTSMSSTRSAQTHTGHESLFSAFKRKMNLSDARRPRSLLTKRRPSSSWEKPPLKRSDLQLDVDFGPRFDFEGEAQQKLDLTLERLR